jgi:hypothetical protein
LTSLEELLVTLADDLAPDAGSADEGLLVHATDVDLDLPMEAVIAPDGRLLATLPRSRIATGFDPPAARLSVRMRRET